MASKNSKKEKVDDDGRASSAAVLTSCGESQDVMCRLSISGLIDCGVENDKASPIGNRGNRQ